MNLPVAESLEDNISDACLPRRSPESSTKKDVPDCVSLLNLAIATFRLRVGAESFNKLVDEGVWAFTSGSNIAKHAKISSKYNFLMYE